ncbi:type IV-A pilus assembly ATPase PilB [bacterium]|nr:type IV-A pilus assembly ATPase PilB [bacterium]
MAKKIGELLVESGTITKEQLDEALQTQKKSKKRIGSILIEAGYASVDDIGEILSEKYQVPHVDPEAIDIERDVLKLIPVEVTRQFKCVPLYRFGNTITLAMVDPFDIKVIDEIKFLTGYQVEPVVAPEISVLHCLSLHYGVGKSLAVLGSGAEANEILTGQTIEGQGVVSFEEEDASVSSTVLTDFEDLISGAVGDIEVVKETNEEDQINLAIEAPVVKLVNAFLLKAIKVQASDCHFEPYENFFRVRIRIDGVLYLENKLPMKLRNPVISRLKIMAMMDISEKRLPQDGRIKMKIGKKREIDFRVSSLPTLFGEKVVLRILDKQSMKLDLDGLGMNEGQTTKLRDAIHKPYGMVLVTGPSGSGKTTTLYSALAELNDIKDNVMTAEDPVEYNFPGINQVQMRDEIGLNFANTLRSFLRQDPDIIMVGEVRDFETAEVAVKASLTGHLVLSTLHTNDAPGTINRLLNMGVEPFLVSSAVILIMAQRLCRKICSHCKEPTTANPEELVKAGFSEEQAQSIQLFKGRGCSMCVSTGYKSRIGLYEVMPITKSIQNQILEVASSIDIRNTAIEEGMLTLRDSGLEKIASGMTSLSEVLRVTFGN